MIRSTTWATTPAAELEALAAAVRRLRPDWRDADAFYELRSEIVAALIRLSRQPVPMPVRIAAPARPPPPRPLTITRYVVAAALSPPPRASRLAHRFRRHRYLRPPSCSTQGVLDLGGRP